MVPSNMQNMRAGGQIPSYQEGRKVRGGIAGFADEWISSLEGFQHRQNLVEQGMDEEEARKKALQDYYNRMRKEMPSYQDGGGIPVALLAAKQKQSPAIIRNDLIKDFLSTDRKEEEEIENNIINLKKQNLQDMASGGLVEMQTGTTVPYASPYGYTDLNPQGVGQFYDFYKTRMQPTQAELDYQEMMRGYFDPEEMKKRNRARQGLDLMRAGLAVGTSATSEDLSRKLDPVITSAADSVDARNKEKLMQAKFEADIAKQDRERDTNIAELAYKSQYTKAMIDQARSRESNWTTTARGLAVDMPEIYAVKLDKNLNPVLDSTTGKPIITGKPNQLAYNEAREMIGYGTVTSRSIAEQSDKEQALVEHMDIYSGSQAIFVRKKALEKMPEHEGKSEDELHLIAMAEERARKRAELGLAAGGQVPSLQMGGQIPPLAEDPPMLDFSSRF
jgi:hypothetical protein